VALGAVLVQALAAAGHGCFSDERAGDGDSKVQVICGKEIWTFSWDGNEEQQGRN
jgi:hypothetical protein